MTHLSFY